MNEHKFIVKYINLPSPDLMDVALVRPDGKRIFAYQPGQYVMIAFRNRNGAMEEKHSFSIVSAPTDDQVLRLGIRIGGRFTRELANLSIGAEVSVYGPYGKFVFDEIKHQEVVFLAGGIGITPFLSALRFATEKRLPNRFWLLHSNRTVSSTPFFHELKELEKKNSNIKTLFSVTNETTPVLLQGLLSERISTASISRFVGVPAGKTYFLCGPKPFMDGMKECLLELGAPEEQILMEEFAMFGSSAVWPRIRYWTKVSSLAVLAALIPFYIIYAANTKNNTDTTMLDSIASDSDSATAESSQTVLNEIVEHLPLAPVINQSATSVGAVQVSKPSNQTIQKTLKTTPNSGSAAQQKTIAPKTPVTQPVVSQPIQPQQVQPQVAPTPTTGASSIQPSGTSPASGAVINSNYDREKDD